MTSHSATLFVNEAVEARRTAGQEVLHLGFGEAGLPVPPGLDAALADARLHNAYGQVAGSPEARAAAAGWFGRRGLPTGPEQILFAPGSKPLLFALLAAIPGDVVLPCPSWVSYAAQAALLGRQVVPVPIPAAAGGIPDPGLLEEALRRAKADGARPGVLILTVPDNPTGTIAPQEQVEAVLAIAERHGLAVVSDEIYAELSHGDPVPAPALHLPERTVVTTGLSKSLSLGGWRIGFARTPSGPWGRRLHQELTGVASETWSSLAAPMQAVAAVALEDPPEVTAHVAASRLLHARVGGAVHDRLRAAGAECRPPQGGFYLYPDFSPLRRTLHAQGVSTGAELAAVLLDRFGVATLPGSAFGDADTRLSLRVATSLLYGTGEQQRRAALHAAQPEALPWIAAALAHLEAALTALTAERPGR
ncbi:pyridoxal phosphate-dependent aminotransferase [Streptomyces sp. NBC_00059]|uniref:pyridoxal phosphate-dependent aminotransferase n=1 Tax=Streptomyces sp. NBC_00059 TaxID=2975635 RepID=UPI00224FCDFB|nr:pyridoxal phosphate-dependent aminotransferase [Streptomyces sp. NBC_00059]MCX5414935.1 pyridoxal phosphate-dependent aminotransferase [Streptomyces sp. NBC_00059]